MFLLFRVTAKYKIFRTIPALNLVTDVTLELICSAYMHNTDSNKQALAHPDITWFHKQMLVCISWYLGTKIRINLKGCLFYKTTITNHMLNNWQFHCRSIQRKNKVILGEAGPKKDISSSHLLFFKSSWVFNQLRMKARWDAKVKSWSTRTDAELHFAIIEFCLVKALSVLVTISFNITVISVDSSPLSINRINEFWRFLQQVRIEWKKWIKHVFLVSQTGRNCRWKQTPSVVLDNRVTKHDLIFSCNACKHINDSLGTEFQWIQSARYDPI